MFKLDVSHASNVSRFYRESACSLQLACVCARRLTATATHCVWVLALCRALLYPDVAGGRAWLDYRFLICGPSGAQASRQRQAWGGGANGQWVSASAHVISAIINPKNIFQIKQPAFQLSQVTQDIQNGFSWKCRMVHWTITVAWITALKRSNELSLTTGLLAPNSQNILCY